MFRSLSLITLLAATLGIATQAKADDVCATAMNLVQNCGFETGDFTGWSVLGDSVHAGVDRQDAYTGAYGAYLAGLGSINLGDTNFTDLQQNLNTTPGTMYTLRFFWAHFANTDVTPDNTFSAYINGIQLFATTQVRVANQDYTYSIPSNFVAGSNTTVLDFLAEDANYYFSLDDVSVTPTPEPANLLLTGPLLAGLYLLRRRRIA